MKGLHPCISQMLAAGPTFDYRGRSMPASHMAGHARPLDSLGLTPDNQVLAALDLLQNCSLKPLSVF